MKWLMILCMLMVVSCSQIPTTNDCVDSNVVLQSSEMIEDTVVNSDEETPSITGVSESAIVDSVDNSISSIAEDELIDREYFVLKYILWVLALASLVIVCKYIIHMILINRCKVSTKKVERVPKKR